MEKVSTDKTLEKFDEFLEEMSSIVSGARSSGDFEKAREDLKRCKGRAVSFLKTKVSEIEGENLELKSKGSFIMGAHLENLSDEVDMYRAFIVSLAEEIKNQGEESGATKK